MHNGNHLHPASSTNQDGVRQLHQALWVTHCNEHSATHGNEHSIYFQFSGGNPHGGLRQKPGLKGDWVECTISRI